MSRLIAILFTIAVLLTACGGSQQADSGGVLVIGDNRAIVASLRRGSTSPARDGVISRLFLYRSGC